MSFHSNLFTRMPRPFDSGHEGLDGLPANFDAGRVYSRQWGLGECCEGNVVKAHDGNVSRDRQARLPKFLHRSKRHHVVCHNHSRWKFGCLQYFMRCATPAFELKVSFVDRRFRRTRKMTRNRVQKGFAPEVGRAEARWSGNMHNVSMAQRDEVFYCFFNPGRVIHYDIAHVLAGSSDIMKDDGHLLASQLIN